MVNRRRDAINVVRYRLSLFGFGPPPQDNQRPDLAERHQYERRGALSRLEALNELHQSAIARDASHDGHCCASFMERTRAERKEMDDGRHYQI